MILHRTSTGTREAPGATTSVPQIKREIPTSTLEYDQSGRQGVLNNKWAGPRQSNLNTILDNDLV